MSPTLITCAHRTAEPGIILWDRQHEYSTSSVYPGFKNESTNPCSEIAMQGGDSCRLIAINLFSFVSDPFTPDARFDHEHFAAVTYETQRLMEESGRTYDVVIYDGAGHGFFYHDRPSAYRA